MRADVSSFFTLAFRSLTIVLLGATLVACKTEKAPDQPTILGVPPSTAYLGVEYYYNFGAYGGEGILDYSLTNAPSWLALEDTSNKARQGVIMRGVPGLTGGNRGEADLGKVSDINLVTTDGSMSGVQPFDVEVKYNPLALETDTYVEGAVSETEEGYREHCSLPNLETTGSHTFTINEYAADGSVTGSKEVTADTHPVLVKIILDQPSVTRVAVAFELTSPYNPDSCDGEVSAPHQRCDYSDANAGDAIIGQDLVALGSNSSQLLEQLDYLTYEQDDSGYYSKGVVTLEPGITECYIRLEVVNDSFPEPSESALITLTEVRSGLAGLGESNSGVKASVIIDDNEPFVLLQTAKGGERDALNVGTAGEYVARLEGERDQEYSAKLVHSDGSTARLGTEFVTETYENNSWIENDILSFPVEVDEVRFRIRVDAAGYSNPALDDRFILLTLDERYQAGRENFARAPDDSVLRVNLNELVTPLVLNATEDFVATDLVVAHSGRVFVAGYDSANNDQVQVRIFNQKGLLLQNIDVSDPAAVLSSPKPTLSTQTREVTSGATKVDRYELAVAYSTDAEITGTISNGGQDVLVHRYWYDSAANGGEYVPDWSIRTGTSGDDVVKAIAQAGDSGYVLVAGETTGTWPEEHSAGGDDSFLQRIDATLDGASYVPALAWSRQVGSSSDDSVAGLSSSSLTPTLFGSARGAVNGASVIGGVDAYFYSTSTASTDISVRQVGTSGDEAVTDGLYDETGLWLVGNSAAEYRVQTLEDGDDELTQSATNTSAGFLLNYGLSGDIDRAITLNDPADQADDVLASVIVFDGDLVVGGSSDGDFTGSAVISGQRQGIAARVSLNESGDSGSDEVFLNEWRDQLEDPDSSIESLGNYRDDEITVLARKGASWEVLVLSPEGVILTP
ncbi:hypothetical protein FWJ25_10940 [Marinobacter salinexigens]|uniref:Uncharacterized protein n=1 Tax=Marinobacter salinexigens TaxID=2919747 RepID=A0A5B0VJ21_9GAMM|nr:hypothetical protein [Marinobacter salinexigens]KAA1173921.1 hypothetical protein FWJ25_10940 [Marinobacter salinexigens]